VALLDAPVRLGAPWLARQTHLARAMEGAALVVTGEGRLDGTTAEGKVVSHVQQMAADHGIPTIAVVGEVASPSPAQLGQIISCAELSPDWDQGFEDGCRALVGLCQDERLGSRA
jgi:glycerate kinase